MARCPSSLYSVFPAHPEDVSSRSQARTPRKPARAGARVVEPKQDLDVGLVRSVIPYSCHRVGGAGLIRRQWLLVVAIVAGLVGMHHLITGHGMSMAVTPDSGSVSMSAAPTEHSHASHLGIHPVEARLVSSSAGMSQADCCGSMDMAGQCCLAVLTTVTALAAALMVAAAWRRVSEPGYLLVTLSAPGARGPPTGCARFTQLCVLRR